MNRLLRGKQTIPFTIGFAGLGMGLLMELWMGAASPSAVLLAPIGIALLVLSLGVLAPIFFVGAVAICWCLKVFNDRFGT